MLRITQRLAAMKILFSSYHFAPDVGGIETVSALLALEFVRVGHEVRLITTTQPEDGRSWPFAVLRKPSCNALWREVRWCDVFFQNNISLQTLWPALLKRKPLVIAHHTWLTAPDGHTTWQTRLKRLASRFAENIAISRAIASHVGTPSVVIGNPYDDATFRLHPEVPRERELIFLGRLVSDKGVDLLLDALGKLFKDGCRPFLTVVGSGPEDAALHRQAAALGISDQVEFTGAQKGEALARSLNRHRILVVPSRWAEPFGVVALEGIACGCLVVGSKEGGLPEAIGPCGVTFRNGDSEELATALRRLLDDEALIARLCSGAATHLQKHSPQRVAAAYLEVLREACR